MRLLLPLLTILIVLAGCSRGSGETLVRLPPPLGWEEDLRVHRGAKDEHYKISASSPLLAEDRETFVGLDYFEPAPELYFVGPLKLYPSPEKFDMITTGGQQRPCERFAHIDFPIGGTMQRQAKH